MQPQEIYFMRIRDKFEIDTHYLDRDPSLARVCGRCRKPVLKVGGNVDTTNDLVDDALVCWFTCSISGSRGRRGELAGSFRFVYFDGVRKYCALVLCPEAVEKWYGLLCSIASYKLSNRFSRNE
jgi:hypothetical protein